MRTRRERLYGLTEQVGRHVRVFAQESYGGKHNGALADGDVLCVHAAHVIAAAMSALWYDAVVTAE